MTTAVVEISPKSDYVPCTTLTKDAMKEILIKMRMKTSKTFPFLSDLIYSRDFLLSDGTESWTDGKKIIISTSMPKNIPELAKIWYEFAGLHEIMHLVFQHLPRFRALKGRQGEHMLFNVLADQIINEMILREMEKKSLITDEEKTHIQANFVTSNNIEKYLDNLLVPKWREKVPPQQSNHYYWTLNYDKLEQAFALLRPLLKSNADSNIGSKWWIGTGTLEKPGSIGSNLTEEDIIETNKDIRKKILGGIIGGMFRGTTKGSLEEMIETLWVKGRVSWKQMLINAIRTNIRGARSWVTLHKKSYCTETIIPGFSKGERYKLMIAVDVSGSISTEQIQNALIDIFWLMKKYKAEVEFLTFDTTITMKKTLKRLSDIQDCKKVHGRGGTSYLEVIEYAKKRRATLLVIFTDGYGDQDKISNPGVKIWWIVDNTNSDFKIGRVIRVDSYDQ
jgi:predicted metal-dependent peptidase